MVSSADGSTSPQRCTNSALWSYAGKARPELSVEQWLLEDSLHDLTVDLTTARLSLCKQKTGSENSHGSLKEKGRSPSMANYIPDQRYSSI